MAADINTELVEMRNRARGAQGVHPTLPGRDYYAPEVFELEREQIFYGQWMCVAREEQLPNSGDYLVREIIDESVLIVRQPSGGLAAFYNVCRHRGSRLCDQRQGNAGGGIRCPYHAWTYSLDGRLRGTPNVGKVEGFSKADYPLHPVALETWEGFIFVSLAEQPGSLLEQLGPYTRLFERYAVDELRIGHSIAYDVAANWKIIVENYSECLHCPTVHPELCELVPLYRKGLTVEEDDTWGNRMTEGATTFSRTGHSKLPGLPGLSDTDRRTYYGSVVFPNLILNYHSDHVMTYLLEDITPERTRIVSDFLFQESTVQAEGFDPSEVVDLWDLVSRQDWAICERAQKGVKSRAYRNGGVYPPPDIWVYEFNQRYLRARDGAG